MHLHSLIFVFFAQTIRSTICAPAYGAIVPSSFELPRLPGLPDLPSIPGIPDIPSIPSIPSMPGIPNLDGLLPTLESSGCEFSKASTVGDFNNSQILGNWFHLYHSKNALTDKLTSGVFKVSNLRHTIAEDAFYSTALHVFVCARNTYLGGLYSHDICPGANYKFNIQSGGILQLEIPSVVQPAVASLVPRLSFDKMEERVIALEKDYVILYGCILPLDDGTCAKNGLHVDIYGRDKQIPTESMEKLKAVVGTTCLNFDNLIPIAQEGDFPFYVPTSEDLWQ